VTRFGSMVGALLASWTATSAWAAACPPDALGVSRVVQVGTAGGLEVGLKSYPHTIPLDDHEVILTFDDGPDAKNTPLILKALADECVKATFFVIGRNVAGLPDLTRSELAAGHTIAHHTFTHPQPTLRYMAPDVARADILKGMATVEHTLYGVDFPPGQPSDLSQIHLHTPWFRFPGFADTKDIREWFKANNVGTFGVDEWASDWLVMTPEQELKLIMGRLDREGRGMLLFHDNHPWTAAMMPMFLKELKAKHYRIVQMVPGPGQGPTVDAPGGWSSATEKILGRFHPRLLGTPVAPGPAPMSPAPDMPGDAPAAPPPS